jgi:hypothetical protein
VYIRDVADMRLLVLVVVLSALAALAHAAEDHQCHYCELDTFCFVDTQYQCPQHSSSPAGSDDLTDCVCHAGFFLCQSRQSLCVRVCVFITAVPIIKLFAWGEGDSGGHVLRETTSRGLCGLVCPSRTSERRLCVYYCVY